MTPNCASCQGGESSAASPENRPGLNALMVRSGTWASIFQAMKDRLSGSDLGPLASLGTRAPDDFSIALLDAWAAVCDVATFYNERIANEGYLRTAIERRSIVELARLVGYTLRPGLSASTFLAYVMEKDSQGPILAGARAQSVPVQGELPQTFETSETLQARAAWNNLAPRAARPPFITLDSDVIYLKGQVLNIKPNDPLLLVDPLLPGADPTPVYIESVELQATVNRTMVTLQKREKAAPAVAATTPASPVGTLPATTATASAGDKIRPSLLDHAIPLLGPLSAPPAQHPADALQMASDVKSSFAPNRDDQLKLLTSLHPELTGAIYAGLQNLQVSAEKPLEVHAFRVRTAPFGASAPLKTVPVGQRDFASQEWTLQRQVPGEPDTYSFVFSVQREPDPILTVGTTSDGPSRLWSVRVTITKGKEPPVQLNVSATEGGPFTDPTGQLTGTVTPGSNQEPFFSLRLSLPNGISITAVNELRGVTVNGVNIHIQTVNVKLEAVAGTRGAALIFTIGGTGGANTVPGGASEAIDKISLDAHYDNLIPGTWVLVDQNLEGQRRLLLGKTMTVADRARADYGISGKSTELTVALTELKMPPPLPAAPPVAPPATPPVTPPVAPAVAVRTAAVPPAPSLPWIDLKGTLSAIRATTVYAGSEKLELADEPMPTDVRGARVELDGLYEGLESGRWLIVSGERTDIGGSEGVQGAELVMLGGVEQSIQRVDKTTRMPVTPEQEAAPGVPGIEAIDLPGDKLHSFLLLANPLSYTYKTPTVTIYGNVVHATHGETRPEVLGSGDGSKPLQTFQLRQPPLTYVAAATPAGAQSTLQVRVNGRLWQETDTLTGSGPNDRDYTTRIDDDGKTFVTFGNGVEGARLPTGVENVSAVYRNGIGRGGNLAAGRISLLGSRPQGVKDVINPIAATGGADREDRDSARRNAPLAVTSLDRLVSTHDYADLARTYAGIGKAVATRIAKGEHEIVHLTVAGSADIPIDEGSDLQRNLLQALYNFGDPYRPLEVVKRARLLLVISAKVRLLSDYLWELVLPKIKAALGEAFGFDRRQLGQDVLLSEVVSAIQGVEGVSYVEVDQLETVSDDAQTIAADINQLTKGADSPPRARIRVEFARPDKLHKNEILPAQIAVLDLNVPATLSLMEIQS